MAHHASFRHVAFGARTGFGAVQTRITAAVAAALLVGIGLGAASIAPRSGWQAATVAPAALTQDAWLVRAASARG